MKVVGIENVDYISRKTGRPVQGIKLHITYEKKNVEGVVAESVFCKPAAFADGVPILGDNVDFLYNRWGNVEAVSVSR